MLDNGAAPGVDLRAWRAGAGLVGGASEFAVGCRGCEWGLRPDERERSGWRRPDIDPCSLYALADLADDNSDDSDGHSVSSGNNDLDLKTRDTVLDDALFGFLGAAKASKGRNLGCKDNRLFFPIVDSHHWFLFAVDFEFKLFAFLDSYHDKDSSFHKRMKNSLVDNFIHLWELIISEDHDFGNFKIMYPNVPKQLTVVDCGVFVMKFMEIWKPFLDLRRFFSHEDILNIRIQYAIKLFFHSDNEADLRLVLDFHSKC
ncbi:hypothetical protein ACQ4PT_018006 [Festuca glaucescens]